MLCAALSVSVVEAFQETFAPEASVMSPAESFAPVALLASTTRLAEPSWLLMKESLKVSGPAEPEPRDRYVTGVEQQRSEGSAALRLANPVNARSCLPETSACRHSRKAQRLTITLRDAAAFQLRRLWSTP
jgi:hypothetical protein